jgi:signal peptidase I
MLFLVVITIYVFGQRLAGIHHPKVFDTAIAIVLSGSMEPEIPTYSIVVINTENEYQPGDIVTYINSNNVSITHRIIDIKDNQFIVKGDTNLIPDPPIHKNEIVGTVKCIIPYQYPLIVIIILVSIIIASLVWPENKERYKNVTRRNEINQEE